MDIELLSMVMSQQNFMQQASMSVMKQAMGSAEQQCDAPQSNDYDRCRCHSTSCSATFRWKH